VVQTAEDSNVSEGRKSFNVTQLAV